jgi:hypothetical protein
MKKTIGVLGILLSLNGITKAQELGVRFGEIVGGNVAVDGVFNADNSAVYMPTSLLATDWVWKRFGM